jgi:hypothetical protein
MSATRTRRHNNDEPGTGMLLPEQLATEGDAGRGQRDDRREGRR